MSIQNVPKGVIRNVFAAHEAIDEILMQRIAKLHHDVVDDRRKSAITDQRKQKGVNRSVPMSVWNSNNLMRLESVENATDGLAGVGLYLRATTESQRRPE